MLVLALSLIVFFADTRTPPEATQHARDELANCYSQHRPECPTPTLVPTATPTPVPVAASTAVPSATPTTEPTVAPVTEQPCWVVDADLGDPDNGYVVFDDEGAPIPCSQEEPVEDATPEATATPLPPPTPTAPSRPAAAPPGPRAVGPGPAPSPVTVMQTVVVQVVVTATPAPTRVPTSSPTLTATATATSSPTPRPTALAFVPLGLPTAVATPAPRANEGDLQEHWSWPAFLGFSAAAIGMVMLLVALVLRRRVAVCKGGHTRA